MAGFRNISFDNRNTNTLRYLGPWFQGAWNASNVGQTGTLSTSNDPSASVTFDFPQPAVAFYYYGIRRSKGGTYGICVDCDPNNQNFETIDAVNFTDDGKNPPVLLFSRQFPTPAVHEIILRNQPDTRFANNNSQIDIDRFEIQVIDPNDPPSPTSPASTPTSTQITSASSGATTQLVSTPSTTTQTTSVSSTTTQTTSVSSTTTQTASVSSATTTQLALTSPTTTTAPTQVTSGDSPKTPVGKIVGGVLGGLALLLIILTLWLWCWRKRNQRIKESDTASGSLPTTLQSQVISKGRMSEVQTSTSQPDYTKKLGNDYWPIPSLGSSSDQAPAAKSSGRVIQREVDAGPVGGDVETLPPDYDQAVAGPRATRTPDYSPHQQRHVAESSGL